MKSRSQEGERSEGVVIDARVATGPSTGRRFADRMPAGVLGFLLLGGLLSGLAVSGCVSTRVSDIDAYQSIPMSRVVPYPDAEELQKRAFQIIVVDRASPGIGDDSLLEPRRWSRRQLEGMAAEAGAMVIDRSLQNLDAIRTEGVLLEFDGNSSDLSGADYALATRFSTYRYTAMWKRPFRFLWQTDAEVAHKPGTCMHRTEVEFDVQVIEIGA